MDAHAVAGPSGTNYRVQDHFHVENNTGSTSASISTATATSASSNSSAARLLNGTYFGPSTSTSSRLSVDKAPAPTSSAAAAARQFVRASSAPFSDVKGGSVTYSSADGSRKPVRLPTGYCYSSKMKLHAYVGDDEDDVHPEKPERIVKIYQRFQEGGVLARMERIAVREALKEEAMLVHSAELWEKVNSFAGQPADFYTLNRSFFNKLSLYVNEHTAIAARLSLGGVIETCRAVADGRIGNAFAIVRPPGHHAEPQTAMGFCFYNNVAVAANYLKTVYADQGIKKILILDWDVHHGNGTQKAFWTDPDVLYISIHRYDNGDFYPGGTYGAAEMVGGQNAKGKCVNIPWPGPGMTDADYLYAFQRIVMPIAYEFAPDFVLVSAGFDAAEGDTLGECHVTPLGYAHMTHMLSSLANGRMVVALEGGYNVDAISNSALECTKILLGEIPRKLPQLRASSEATRVMHQVAKEQSQYWDCIQPTHRRKEEFEDAGTITPLAEILKAHRTHHLYHKHGLYNVPISNPILEATFKDQLLVSDNIFKASTLVLLVHDMGSLRAELNAMTADVKIEKSFLVVDWIISQKFALVDVNILAHSESINSLDRAAIARRERDMVLHVWDHIVQLSNNITSVVLIGQSIGCQAITHLLNERSVTCRKRVKAAVQIFDLNPPGSLLSNADRPGLRAWFYGLSMAVFPTKHWILEAEVRLGKRYGNVIVSREARPTHVLADRWKDIQRFILTQLGLPVPDPDPEPEPEAAAAAIQQVNGDVAMIP